MAHILIVDDEPNLRWVLQEALNTAGHHARAAASGEEALRLLAEAPADLVVLDLKLKGMDGLNSLRAIHMRWPELVVLILTAYGTVASAVEALQAGAADYLRKPFDVEEILFKIARSLERRNLQLELERLRSVPPPVLLGNDPHWRRAFEAALQALNHGLDLGLIGEPGSGRATLAQAAVQASQRRTPPLIVLDLATLPAAHQGAVLAGTPAAEGFWAMAGQGVLLLRHAEQLSPAGAATLQQLLERRTARGGGPLLIWTAANAAAGAFISPAASIHVPPLRERPDDMMVYTTAWLPERPITPAAQAMLEAYDWPGNLGELRSVLERAATLAGPAPIDALHLPERLHAVTLPITSLRLPDAGLNLEELEIDLIRQALARTGGNKSRAAELLGLSRHTLLYRLEKYGLHGQSKVSGGTGPMQGP
jgi:DNA-binding NtrC family response regulator